MKRNLFKQSVIMLSLILVMAFFYTVTSHSSNFKNIQELRTIEDVENAIYQGTLREYHYLNEFGAIAANYENPDMYRQYLDGVWLSRVRSYDAAMSEFLAVLEKLEDYNDPYLEMHLLEKMMEINKVNGNLIKYQENGFKLRVLATGVDDKLYIKALYAIADAHYQTYNDDTARSYLTVIFEESTRISYDLGLSLYHSLYGDIEYSYNNYDDAKYHYQKAYVYSIEADRILGYSYMKMLELRLASIETNDERYEEAYNRIGFLLDDIENESDHMKREIYMAYGEAASNLERYQESIAYYELALTSNYLINKEYETHSLMPKIYIEIGFAYAALNEFEKAVDYFQLAHNVVDFQESDATLSEQVSSLSAYEVDELQRELAFKQKLRDANEETIVLQRKYLRIGFGLLIALFFSVIILVRLYFARGKVQKKLYFESITDHLTKVFNRGQIIKLLEDNKYKTTSILMMDVDDFKMINDTFGHVVGDKVLVQIAKSIKSNLRGEDYVGRYGGEEFLVILRNTDLEKGLAIAERIREAVENMQWEEDIVTSISIGMLQCHDADTDELLAEADLLMYRAKSLGKNRVVF